MIEGYHFLRNLLGNLLINFDRVKMILIFNSHA